jgi:hypothetical protein
MLENEIEATARHLTPRWGKGSVSELTGRVHRGDVSMSRSPNSKNAAFFSSRIDVAPATLVQLAKKRYHMIAWAGSLKGM